jgi:hypothetical protein
MTAEVIFYNTLGFIGMLFILFGFYRISIGKWTGKSFWYELDNVVGALLIIAYQVHYHAYVTVLLNAIWALVAFRGLTSYAQRASSRKKRSSTSK